MLLLHYCLLNLCFLIADHSSFYWKVLRLFKTWDLLPSVHTQIHHLVFALGMNFLSTSFVHNLLLLLLLLLYWQITGRLLFCQTKIRKCTYWRGRMGPLARCRQTINPQSFCWKVWLFIWVFCLQSKLDHHLAGTYCPFNISKCLCLFHFFECLSGTCINHLAASTDFISFICPARIVLLPIP